MKPIEVGKGPLGNGERKKGKEGTKSDDSFPQRGKSLKETGLASTSEDGANGSLTKFR